MTFVFFVFYLSFTILSLFFRFYSFSIIPSVLSRFSFASFSFLLNLLSWFHINIFFSDFLKNKWNSIKRILDSLLHWLIFVYCTMVVFYLIFRHSVKYNWSSFRNYFTFVICGSLSSFLRFPFFILAPSLEVPHLNFTQNNWE
jgi:hypothetical protein